MFQSSAKRLQALLSRVDDILADHPQETRPPAVEPRHEQHRPEPRAHPHRRHLRWERARRPGSVPAAPAHCISPVRTARGAGQRASSAR